MRVVVDPDACTACGLCADTCPRVYVMGDTCAEVVADPVPCEHEKAAREAADGCPVDAISVKE